MTAPEVNFAARLVAIRELIPPIDVASLAREYATVEHVVFPVNIDGVCLDLKQKGKRPRILVNQTLHKHRLRFTLAHELGHVIIPWHVGSIVDETEESHLDLAFNYWDLEGEANRFASELLMPSTWTKKIIADYDNPITCAEYIAREAEVSFAAAIIKIQNLFPKGYLYARYVSQELIASGRSPGTVASMPNATSLSPHILFAHAANHWTTVKGFDEYHIWRFHEHTPLGVSTRPWRETLTEIASEIGVPADQSNKFKQRVMAVVSFANGSTKGARTPEAVNSAAIQRLHANIGTIPYVEKFLVHPKLNELLAAKILEFFKEK